MHSLNFNDVMKEFVILTLLGVMEDGYLPYDGSMLTMIDGNMIKIFRGEKELVKKCFDVNYHKIFIQDGKEPLIYMVSDYDASVGNFLMKTKGDLLEVMFRKFLINIYASLRTVVYYNQYVGEVESISFSKMNQLLDSFGFPEKLKFLPNTMKRRLLRVLVRFYKRKGTKHVLKFLNRILGLNINLYEIYAYYNFLGQGGIKYEYYNEVEEKWEEVDDNLYDIDVRAFVTEQTFLR
ncbi:MAG: hypothetical protein N3A69_09325 [Leptospiraceae bacterium]|nr:hypothetical protein [Leptospiraceae bacterium]